MITPNTNIADRERTVCITGPKPEKLPCGGNRASQVTKVLRSVLYKAIIDSAEEGYNCFITGFTEGIELWAGEIIMGLKAQNKDTKLIIVSSYRGYTDKFRNDEKFLAGNIVLKADRILYMSENYSGGCIQKKNKYMIDHSGKLIAVVPDSKIRKGTIVDYAEKNGIITRIIDAGRLEEQIREEAFVKPVRKHRKILF